MATRFLPRVPRAGEKALMRIGEFGFRDLWVLLALPLALVPLWRARFAESRYPWTAMLPADALSEWIDRALRILAAMAIAVIVLALAAPYRAQPPVERVAQGAEIVLLLDRSRSMDQAFAGDPKSTWWSASQETKARVAARLLAQFAQHRGHDRIGMVVFSTLPIRIIPLTGSEELVQAAIQAGGLGRGLGETDLGRGLLAALGFFPDRAYTGSRIVVLVSDGGAELDYAVCQQITQALKRERVTLYWLYLRSYGSPGLVADAKDAVGDGDATAPERALHAFFRAIGTPYRAYEAENPQALERAMEDVNRLENFPIRYREVLAPRDLSRRLYVLALMLSLALLAAKGLEIERWH